MKRVLLAGVVLVALESIAPAIAELAENITDSYIEQPFIVTKLEPCANTLPDEVDPLCVKDPPNKPRQGITEKTTNPQFFGDCSGLRIYIV